METHISNEQPDKSKPLPACPIPPGWTVRVYRTERAGTGRVLRGVGLRAEHECGRGFTFHLGEVDPGWGPIEAVGPDGDRELFRETVVEYGEERFLAILWSACPAKIREWEDRHCHATGCDCPAGEFTPPPHENAEVHARVMARLETMSREELIAADVRAGIRTPDGQLTAPYRADEPAG